MSMKISRRTLLAGGAVGAVGAVALGATALAARPRASVPRPTADTLPLTVVNQTGQFDNSSVWLYILGTADDRQVWVTPEGELRPVSLDDNGADGYTDYAIPLAGSGDTTIQLPHLSGRIYVALGDKLKIRAVEDGNGNPALAYPAGWVDSDPSYQVLHDCAEFTFNADGMFCNTTMVDMFSVPLAIHLTGANDQTAGRLRDGARAAVFDELASHETFGALVQGDQRVIAPSHGLDVGLFPSDYLDGYVDSVWTKYAGEDMLITTNAGTYTGRVSGDQFVFTGPGEVVIDRPSTRDVLFCDGALAAPNDGNVGPVAAILAAALNRTTALSHPEQPADDPAAFYQQEPAHHYARVLHEATEDGRAYGFAFDDVGGFASYIEDGAPQQMTLTLTPF